MQSQAITPSHSLSTKETQRQTTSTLYYCQGTCSKAIEIEAEGDAISRVQFHGGCNGNTKGLQQLVRGMKIDDVIARLEGTTCGSRPTSCPDQLCRALRQLKAQQV